MSRKEEIILSALELAAEQGLKSVSMQQIADKVGIKKPSLYNHFKSKDEIVAAIYDYLRSRAKEKTMKQNDFDVSELLKKVSPVQVLKFSVQNYVNMNREDKELILFYKVLYSERTTNPTAAELLAEETKRMVMATKNLFYAFQVHGLMNFYEIDKAAESFAFTIHGMTDYQMDCETMGKGFDFKIIENYIEWFCKCFGGIENEKNID